MTILYIALGGIAGTLSRYDLPIIIEVVEADEVIQGILPDLSEMIGGGLITLEKAHVILYRPGPS